MITIANKECYVTASMIGRFGNQLFQYAALRVYERQYNLTLQTGPWVGEQLFGIEPSPITVRLANYYEGCGNSDKPCVTPPVGRALCGRNFCGYAQYHTSYFSPSRVWLRELYRPIGALQQRMDEPLRQLRRKGTTLIGLHLRRGDYGRLAFYITPVDWYLAWLRKHWTDYTDPVLFVASEDPSLIHEFAKYNPVSATDLGVDLATEPLEHYPYLTHDLADRVPWQMDFFPDWFLLSECDVMLMPNSTFSMTAAMFSDTIQRVYRSDLPTQEFVEIDPWDCEPLTYDLAEDWKHVEGVCLEENPKWDP